MAWGCVRTRGGAQTRRQIGGRADVRSVPAGTEEHKGAGRTNEEQRWRKGRGEFGGVGGGRGVVMEGERGRAVVRAGRSGANDGLEQGIGPRATVVPSGGGWSPPCPGWGSSVPGRHLRGARRHLRAAGGESPARARRHLRGGRHAWRRRCLRGTDLPRAGQRGSRGGQSGRGRRGQGGRPEGRCWPWCTAAQRGRLCCRVGQRTRRGWSRGGTRRCVGCRVGEVLS